MRKILFRGKQIDNEDWVLGYLWVGNDSCYIIPHRLGINYHEKENRLIAFAKEVAPETVCEYTGLTDKNGMKIFEGDILSACLDDQHPEDTTYVQITWNGYSWCTRESTEDDVMTEHECNVFEVCGNIFDNSELIEK